MSDDEKPTSVAKQQLEQLSKRLHNDPDFADNAAWDGSRALVLSAIKSSNGSQNKVVDMAETQGQLVHFLLQEKLRAPEPITPAQLEVALLKVHDAACPLNEIVTRDNEGKRRIDPSKLKAIIPEEGKSEGMSEINVGLPGGPKLFSFKGRAANAAIKYCVIIGLAYFFFAWFNAKNKEYRQEILREVASLGPNFYTNTVFYINN